MKGLLMKTLFTEEERGTLREMGRSAKRRFVDQVYAKHGTVRVQPIDPHKYPPIKGMEGPFQFRSGHILYYDPKEGRYYDRKTDMYMDRDFDPSR